VSQEPISEGVRDDRVWWPARITAIVIIPILTAAFVILYLFPFHTRRLWAWTINPTMSALFMGAGYLSGAYFFVRVATAKQWSRVGHAFICVTVFAAMLGIGTFVHWDRFNHDHVSFWAWLLLYTSTPFLLPWLWWRNKRTDPGTLAPGDREVPLAVRRIMAVVGALQLGFAAVLFLRPTAITSNWPWPLTPLTARSLSAYAAFPAVGYLIFAFEKRWSALQILIEIPMVALPLIGIAAIRAHAEFEGADLLVWGWRIGLVAAWALLASLWLAMRRPVLPLPGGEGGQGGEAAPAAAIPLQPADQPGQ